MSPIAIIGAGIAGSLTACLLAERGVDTILIDLHPRPMEGASRWNEGKIHLGFTYVGTASLATARLMVEGARSFVPVLERTVGTPLPDAWFSEPVTYLVDPKSIVPAEVLWERTLAVAQLLDPDLPEAAGKGMDSVRRLHADEAMARTGQQRIAAAWQTPERAIAPGPVADSIRGAVERLQVPFLCAAVSSICDANPGWRLETSAGPVLARAVVNCSWQARPALDRPLTGNRFPVSIRYKYGLFGQGLARLARLSPSTRILGRFGDVTPYRNGHAYLGWYPAGLALLRDDGNAGQPPRPPDGLVASTLAGLGLNEGILECGSARWEARGGYVVAHGAGDVDRIDSPLHDRSRPGVHELAPGYFTVDTGKYSLGPMFAVAAARRVGACVGAELEVAG